MQRHYSEVEGKNEIAWGVEEIAQVLEEPNTRRVYYLLCKGLIPGSRKFGNRWMLSITAWRREVHGESA